MDWSAQSDALAATTFQPVKTRRPQTRPLSPGSLRSLTNVFAVRKPAVMPPRQRERRAQPGALVADDERGPIRQVGGEQIVATHVDADQFESVVGQDLDGFVRGLHPKDRGSERHAGRGLDGHRADVGRPAVRNDHTVHTCGGCGSKDHADVGRIVHVVEHEHGARPVLASTTLLTEGAEILHGRGHDVGDNPLVMAA